MLSFAKIIGLSAIATFLPIALGVDTLAGAQGIAHPEFGDYANGLFIDGMKVAGRQAAAVITVTVTASCGSPSGTATPITSATESVTPGTIVSSTTETPSMSTTVPAIPSEVSSVATTVPGTTAPGGTTPTFPSASSEESSVASTTTKSVPPSPTGSTPPSASTTPGNTNGAGLSKFNFIGGLAAVGLAAIAVY